MAIRWWNEQGVVQYHVAGFKSHGYLALLLVTAGFGDWGSVTVQGQGKAQRAPSSHLPANCKEHLQDGPKDGLYMSSNRRIHSVEPILILVT